LSSKFSAREHGRESRHDPNDGNRLLVDIINRKTISDALPLSLTGFIGARSLMDSSLGPDLPALARDAVSKARIGISPEEMGWLCIAVGSSRQTSV
jgi:hypothetical protein